MAKRTSGLKPLWNKRQVTKFFEKAAERAEVMILRMLNEAGEQFVTYARQQAHEIGFYDRTKNLRASIGFVVAKNGQILSEDFKPLDGATEGVTAAKRLSSAVVREYSTGYVLIGVAGMKYAVYVEAMENKDVITNATNFTKDHIKKVSRDLFKSLEV